ncbi:MAG TPA: hypothetical protein VGL72_19950, partial [Bryobacteraceae bacterium]
MFFSRRLAIFSLALFGAALGSAPASAKKTPQGDKALTAAIQAEHEGDFDSALTLISAAIAKKPGDIAYQIASYRIHFE